MIGMWCYIMPFAYQRKANDDREEEKAFRRIDTHRFSFVRSHLDLDKSLIQLLRAVQVVSPKLLHYAIRSLESGSCFAFPTGKVSPAQPLFVPCRERRVLGHLPNRIYIRSLPKGLTATTDSV